MDWFCAKPKSEPACFSSKGSGHELPVPAHLRIPGIVALIGFDQCRATASYISRRIEQLVDELDLALNAWLFVMAVAAFDCSDGLDPAERRLG